MATTKISLGRQTDLNANSNKITLVTDPSNPQDAATKNYVDGLIAASDAVVYKGVIDCSANPNYPAADAGHLYKVSVAGKIGGASGPNVEAGDTLLCTTDGTASGTQAAVGANWDIIQVNIDGAVTGPVSAVSDDFATFNGTTGKIVKDSGFSRTIDGTLAGNSDVLIPSEKAVKTYVDTNALSSANFIIRETPSGSVNGSNVIFTLANTPVSGTEEVFLNGLLQEPGAGNDYTISTGTITYLTAPATGDRLRVSYRK